MSDATTVADALDHRLDPRAIALQRLTGVIVTAILAAGTLLAVGISILTALPVIGSYVASAWLLLVAINLTLGGYFDIAVRDVVLSIGVFSLARLIQVRDQVEVAGATPAPVRH